MKPVIALEPGRPMKSQVRIECYSSYEKILSIYTLLLSPDIYNGEGRPLKCRAQLVKLSRSGPLVTSGCLINLYQRSSSLRGLQSTGLFVSSYLRGSVRVLGYTHNLLCNTAVRRSVVVDTIVSAGLLLS